MAAFVLSARPGNQPERCWRTFNSGVHGDGKAPPYTRPGLPMQPTPVVPSNVGSASSSGGGGTPLPPLLARGKLL
eukprot:CAMPEP_0204070652 /NCGR_PEP_ID=MMETSP0360-20130528/158841_1 /ASSEMBLY_ACC=CAM_ASM_000342 /TAXON_ID=268821 /ORGANISM="Scrippsiella Hangoei, Strain SHTV-5" /LENGTH=74 /DNA_ID=CAMNT_0051018883 /DNA_START=339 /DNA_END=559 /DNA_ORIENTATION=+